MSDLTLERFNGAFVLKYKGEILPAQVTTKIESGLDCLTELTVVFICDDRSSVTVKVVGDE